MASQSDIQFQRLKTEMGSSVLKQLVSLEIGMSVESFFLIVHRCRKQIH